MFFIHDFVEMRKIDQNLRNWKLAVNEQPNMSTWADKW